MSTRHFGRSTLWVSLCFLTVVNNVIRVHGQKIHKQRPSVYISYSGHLKDLNGMACAAGCAKMILVNNTKWPILYTNAYDPTVEQAAIIYTIELKDGSRDPRTRVDTVFSNNRLMPGNRLEFVVPRRDFPNGSKIYIEFSFAWEKEPEGGKYEPTVHRAYFRSSDLPEWRGQ